MVEIDPAVKSESENNSSESINIQSTVTAIETKSRIVSIDVLRGFALLGILLMNIQSFGMGNLAYIVPTLGVNFEGTNSVFWSIVHLIADTKFISIFSMLFGAGVVIASSKFDKANTEQFSLQGMWFHLKRNSILLIFGILHYLLLWEGDVLWIYAVLSFFIYPLRNLSAKLLIVLSIVLFILSVSIFGFLTLGIVFDETIANSVRFGYSASELAMETAAYTGSWSTIFDYKVNALTSNGFLFGILPPALRVASMMILGMALYKLKIFNASHRRKFYLNMVVGGFLVGFPLIAVGLVINYSADFDPAVRLSTGFIMNFAGSAGVALAYVGIVMLVVKSGKFSRITNWLAVYGRTALTNYISHTVIAVLIFYPYGFQLYRQFGMLPLLGITVLIWLVTLIISNVLYTKFQFGPLEWFWRSLTYLRLQPFLAKSSSRKV